MALNLSHVTLRRMRIISLRGGHKLKTGDEIGIVHHGLRVFDIIFKGTLNIGLMVAALRNVLNVCYKTIDDYICSQDF